MSVRICHDPEERIAALYCDLTGVAFGPVWRPVESHTLDAQEHAEIFLAWMKRHCPTDLRNIQDWDNWLIIFPAWLAKQPTAISADDLVHTARTGEYRCMTCGDWFDEDDLTRGLCRDCHSEGVAADCAEAQGDAQRDGV